MWQDARIEPGAAVEATDGRLGIVDEVIVDQDGAGLAYVVVRRGWSNEQLLVPADLIRAINGPREVHLGVTRDEARERAADVPSDALLLARDRGAEVVIPIVEERLIPEKQQVNLGELRVHKYVDSIEEAVQQDVTRDDLVIERVPVNQPIDAPVSTRFEGEWMIVPIMREVLVVKKQLMLAEEVRISKRELTEVQEVREVTRHERLELEDATVHGIAGLDGLGSMGGPDHRSGEAAEDGTMAMYAAGGADQRDVAPSLPGSGMHARPAGMMEGSDSVETTESSVMPSGRARSISEE